MDNVRSVKAGGSHRPTSQSPAEGFDLPFQARSSVELKKMFQHQIKQEKIEKLHERLQGNNREMLQWIVEVVDETPKKGTQQEQVQKVDGNLDKDTMTKKLKKVKLSQPQAMKDDANCDKEVVQRQIDRLQNAFKTVIQQCNPQLNMESIEHLLGLSHGDANSSPKDGRAQMHSSTSIHTPCPEKQVINEDVVQDDIDEEFQEEDVDDEFLEDEFLEDNLSDEFQDDDLDDDLGDEFQENDLDDEIQEDDIDDEFEVDDLGDELQDKLE